MSDAFDEETCPPAPPEGDKITVEDFVAYLPAHTYIFIPCRETWAAAGVDARVPPIPVQRRTASPN